jgi:Ca2+-dependent lipid-binding protein, contains C2 domain
MLINRFACLTSLIFVFILAGKSDHYAELIVDGEPPRKTEIIRKTQEPKWDEIFTV